MGPAPRGGAASLTRPTTPNVPGALPAPIGPQETGPSPFPDSSEVLRARRALRDTIDRLIPLAKSLGERADEARRRRRLEERAERQVRVDTFRVGPFRAVARPAQEELARTVLMDAWDQIRPLVGDAGHLLDAWTFLVDHAWSNGDMLLTGDSLRRVVVPRRRSRTHLEREAADDVGRALGLYLPESIRQWTGGRIRTPPHRMPWVARALVTTPSVAVRRCYRGEARWCLEALGLKGREEAWQRWYTLEERVLLLRRRGRPRGDPREAALWDGCVESGLEEACGMMLEDLPMETRIPLGQEARASFLEHVLRAGGAQTFQALRDAESGPLLQRLERAAGVPADSLAATWRARVLDARPSAWAGLVKSPLSGLFWVLVLALLAGRSTRWRLG